MSCIASDFALEIGATFRAMLDQNVDRTNWRLHLAADYTPLAAALLEGEWERIGRADPRAAPELSLFDLCILAEHWGTALVPLPYLPTVALRYAGWDAPARELVSCVLPSQRGGSVTPYFTAGRRVATAQGIVAVGDAAGSDVDAVDEFMPLGYGRLAGPVSAQAARNLAILAAAEAIGGASEVLRMACEYAGQREAFGKPIVGFQAIRHLLADMYRDVEISRAALARAIAEPPSLRQATAFVFRRCRAVAENCIQVHGGYGFTWEAGLHFYLRHIMALGELTADAAMGTP